MSDAIDVTIGQDHLQALEAVAQAASDLRIGRHEPEFAEANGGMEKLERDLFDKVADYEALMCALIED